MIKAFSVKSGGWADCSRESISLKHGSHIIRLLSRLATQNRAIWCRGMACHDLTRGSLRLAMAGQPWSAIGRLQPHHQCFVFLASFSGNILFLPVSFDFCTCLLFLPVCFICKSVYFCLLCDLRLFAGAECASRVRYS